jgi:hypothetical protein
MAKGEDRARLYAWHIEIHTKRRPASTQKVRKDKRDPHGPLDIG